MADNISKIKDRLNVVDVIAGYIKVQKAGVNFKARCPFHNEKTPSFYISPERQIWHCFGCQAGGDIFGFVKQIEGVEFPEAMRILAQRAGIELEAFDPKERDEKTKLYEICETAARFFEKQLHQSSTGKKAYLYLKERGLKDQTIKDFRLGYAPDDWQALTKFLKDCGYKEEDIIGAGLAIQKQSTANGQQPTARIYDRFRSRIMFPIADANDRVVGFTGRIFETENSASNQLSVINYQRLPEAVVAKYINTPQTAIYDKSRVLYGLNKAKLDIRKSDNCILVEGNMDAVMSYQAGVKNVVASSGTALTPNHLRMLQRYTGNLSFCFDADQAGNIAARRGIGLALAQNFNIKMVKMEDKECKDPADFVKKYGIKWNDIVQNSQPALDFYFNKSKSEFDSGSPEGKKKILAVLAPLINRLASRVEKAHWISQLALLFRAPESAVQADINSAKDDLAVYEESKPETAYRPPAGKDNYVPADRFSRAVLAIIIKNPGLFKDDLKNINCEMLSPAGSAIIKSLLTQNIDNLDLDKFARKLDENTALEFNIAFLEAQELWADFKDEELKREFYGIINKLEYRAISARLASLELDIKAAENKKDKERLSALLSEFDNFSKKIPKLRG